MVSGRDLINSLSEYPEKTTNRYASHGHRTYMLQAKLMRSPFHVQWWDTARVVDELLQTPENY